MGKEGYAYCTSRSFHSIHDLGIHPITAKALSYLYVMKGMEGIGVIYGYMEKFSRVCSRELKLVLEVYLHNPIKT